MDGAANRVHGGPGQPYGNGSDVVRHEGSRLLTDFHIALNRALLCPECDSIYSMPRSSCPSCNSTSALVLARVLGERSEIVSGLRAFADMLSWARGNK